MTDPDMNTNQLLCFAHRGASGHAPENTLAAFEKAIELGADWIETDVHLADGELLNFHDYRLERCTNGSGYISDKSLAYLRGLNAGDGQRIPLLTETLDLIDRRSGINIEIKSPKATPQIAAVIDDYIRNRAWSYDQFIVSSFDHPTLKEMKYILPQIKVAPLLYGIPLEGARFARALQAYSIHISGEFLTEAFVQDAHRQGMKVFVFTVNFSDDLQLVRSMGVDGVITDYPEIITRNKTILPDMFKKNL